MAFGAWRIYEYGKRKYLGSGGALGVITVPSRGFPPDLVAASRISGPKRDVLRETEYWVIDIRGYYIQCGALLRSELKNGRYDAVYIIEGSSEDDEQSIRESTSRPSDRRLSSQLRPRSREGHIHGYCQGQRDDGINSNLSNPNALLTMDLSDPLPLLKALVPKLPLISKAALSHALRRSPTAKHWDLKTALTIALLRSFIVGPFLAGPVSSLKTQRMTLKDPGIKGNLWISKVTLPVTPADDDVRQAVFGAIDHLHDGPSLVGSYTPPTLDAVTAEWTGHRAAATASSLLPDISEADKYTELMKEVVSPATTLYFHGGAYYLMDPATHRPTTAKLARLTTGRVLSVRYRLAPQHPFPSALLDALVAYLSLLYPPTGSLHAAVPAAHIVLSGDSAGGNLCTSLALVLLTLQRQNRRVIWHGSPRAVPLPAGLALNSPWMDITGSSPSCGTNALYDYLPSLDALPCGLAFAADAAWPASPPRKTLYAGDALVLHPLVSPLAARETAWDGLCAVWVVAGWELLSDEIRCVAGRMARAGAAVRYVEFEGMPHCFAMVFEGSVGEKRCFEEWAGWVRGVVGGEVGVGGVVIRAKKMGEREVDVRGFAGEEEEAIERMRGMLARMGGGAETAKL